MKICKTMVLLLLVCACSQNKPVVQSNPEIPPIYVSKTASSISIRNDTVYENNEKYSGYLLQFQSNKVDTLSIAGYYQGLQSGLAKKWYSKNSVMEERQYLAGEKNGKQIAFWENGNKKFEFEAVKDMYQGVLKEWNQEGNLVHLANYKEGQEEGTQKLWYDNGKVRANYVIKNGKRYGLLGTKNCRNVSDSIFIVR
mgnify:CR=1 FL=1